MVFYESNASQHSNERVPMLSYEKLKALEILVEENQADRPAVFELFTRNIDMSYTHFTVAGISKAVEQLLRYSYTKMQVEYMSQFVSLKTIDYLSDYRYTGSLFGLTEGSMAFPFTPILTANCTLGEGIIAATLLETLMTKEINTATACAHITQHVGAVPVVDNFSAAESEQDSDETARTAYMTGFSATTNMKGSLHHRIPLYDIGTRTHFPAFSNEEANYQLLHKHQGREATYLINTDNISKSIETAAHQSEGSIHAVRVETKHYLTTIPAVREQLDIIGAESARIILSGDFTHTDIQSIKNSNIPTDVIICNQNPASAHKASQFTFNVVAVEQNGNYTPVASSGDENSIVFGGIKTPYREFNDDWEISSERLIPADSLNTIQGVDLNSLQETYIKKGSLSDIPSTKASRDAYHETMAHKTASQFTVKLGNTTIWGR